MSLTAATKQNIPQQFQQGWPKLVFYCFLFFLVSHIALWLVQTLQSFSFVFFLVWKVDVFPLFYFIKNTILLINLFNLQLYNIGALNFKLLTIQIIDWSQSEFCKLMIKKMHWISKMYIEHQGYIDKMILPRE